MISIVNRTTFTTTSTVGPQNVTIPATTAGNTLVVAGMKPGISSGLPPKLGGVPLGFPAGMLGSGLAYTNNIPGGQTVLTFGAVGPGGAPPSAVVVYELTPCTLDDTGTAQPTPAASETGVSVGPFSRLGNSAYFEVIEQGATGGAYNSVNSPWIFDYTLSPLPQTGDSMGSVVYILNVTSTQTPIWNVTNPGSNCGVSAITLLESGTATVGGVLAETQVDAYPAGVSNAFARFRLRDFAGTIPTVLAGGLLATITGTLDAGAISQSLVPNSSISPAGTFYTIEIWSNGRITSSGNATVTGSGDLSTLL